MKKLVCILIIALPFLGFTWRDSGVQAPKMKLSEYEFFKGDIAKQEPADGVIPYHLNTPLFTDHAEKLRFVKLPAGESVPYNDTAVFDFPVGTALIKTFYYPVDFRDPSKGRKIMETRILLHEANGWKALPYIWNESQTDAELDVSGESTSVSYTDPQGKKRSHAYVVPNMNQCKGCHNKAEKMMPIGPSAWQLNGEHDYRPVKENQLAHWASSGILKSYEGHAPKGVIWNDPSTGSVDERARVWLDINCAHCHRGDGPASTSGLHLGWQEQDKLKIGIGKTPVAAGRGSGNLRFSIVPGKPDESIILYRIRSTDPGIMMPELGRTQMQPEAVALIREWIAQLAN
jgi:uncharacterized repeat protein (TIGR03806 family)